MMIPSAPAVPVASAISAGASGVGAKGSAATPTGPFDSLLPKDTSSEPGFGKGGKSFPAEENAKADDGANVSIQALQANLAAMLHTIPAVQTPVATTLSLTATPAATSTTATAALATAVDPTMGSPDITTAAATTSLAGVPISLPGTAVTTTAATTAATPATGVTLPNPATTAQDPTQTATQPVGGGGHHGGGHGGGVRALRKVQEEEEVTAVKKTTAAAQPEETAEAEEEAPATVPQTTPFDALIKTPAEAATAATVENPAMAGDTDPDGSSQNESEQGAEIAALDQPAENLPKTDAAIPALPTLATPSPVPIVNSRMIFQPTAKPDAHLVSEEMAAVKKMGGTAGAKGERDMNSVSTKPQNSSTRTTAAQPGETSPVTAKSGAGDDTHGQKQSGSEESASTDHTRTDLDKTDHTFSAAVPTDNFSVSRPVTASTSAEAATAAKSTSASSVLDEVGMGLERIQQGSNRLDLHVTLEGGGHVNIELQLRDGAVHASFLTSSTELRTALQQSWSQMTSRSESLGLQMADPTFKTPPAPTPTNSFSSFTQTGQQDSRGQRQAPQSEQTAGSSFTPSFTSTKPSGTAKAPTRSLNSGLNEWA